MVCSCTHLQEYFENIVDWECLQRLHLRACTIVILLFELVINLFLLFTIILFHFVYVGPAGSAGFLYGQWIVHTGISKFSRNQPWEQLTPIDWDQDDRQYIKDTRWVLDQNCSRYANENHLPGDPGDYLLEVVEDPKAGYEWTVQMMVTLFLAAVMIMYLSQPLLLLSLWWKMRRGSIVAIYIFVRCFPPVLLSVICHMARTDKMCAVDIIYDRQPIRTYIIVFTVLLWLYEIVKFIILTLFCVEGTLAYRRIQDGYGFQRKKVDEKMKRRKLKEEAEKQQLKEEKQRQKEARNKAALKLEESIASVPSPGDDATGPEAEQSKNEEAQKKPKAVVGIHVRRKAPKQVK